MLGELEQLVLLAILRIGDQAYGVAVLGELERQTGRTLTLATVHKTLARLEDKGLIASRLGEPTPLRGGRAKRYYDLTAAGQRSLGDALGVLRRMAQGLVPGWGAP